jgi:hypothetical protein
MAKRTSKQRKEVRRKALAHRRLALGRGGPGGVVLGEDEFAAVFRLPGGLSCIGHDFPHRWQAVSGQGRRMRRDEFGVADRLLGIDRDQASKFMARARDAEAWRILRENHANVKTQKRTTLLLDAAGRCSTVWCRDRDVLDQQLRYVLSGTNSGIDPTRESAGQIVCWRDGSKDGVAYVAEETWNQGWSEPDADGIRERIGVETDEPMLWPSSDVARRATITLMHLGEIPGPRDGEYLLRHRADKLLRWERAVGGEAHAELVDKKAELEVFRPETNKASKLPPGQIWIHKPAFIGKRNVDPKDLAALQNR